MTTLRLACFALLLPLCGCFEITETVEVHPDGKGSHAIEQRLHDVAEFMDEDELADLRGEIAALVAELESLDGVESAEGSVEVDDADLLTRVRYTVTKFEYLGRVDDQARLHAQRIADEHGLGGVFHFEELGQGRYRWTYPLGDEGQLQARTEARERKARLERAQEAGSSPDALIATLEQEPRRAMIRYRFRAPQVLSAEGAEVSGDEAAWDFPLDCEDELELPEALVAEFSVRAPFPWGYALLGGGISCALVGGLWLRGKWNRRWE